MRPPLHRYMEAAAYLVIASAAIRVVPISKLLRWRRTQASEYPVGCSGLVRDIRRTIDAIARRLPWRALCLERGLAAHWLLAHRGRQSTLFYGAALLDGQLKAHVWVRSGALDVIGCENADEYALLASFPNDDPVSKG